MGSNSDKSLGYQNAVSFTLFDEIQDTKGVKSETKNSVMFYLPTSEMARNLVVYLKRSVLYPKYSVDLMYRSPDGFRSLYDDGPNKVVLGKNKYSHLQKIWEANAVSKMTVEVFRDLKYGKDMTIQFYFYSLMDLAFASSMVKVGLNQLYTVISCEKRIRDTHDWIQCEPSGLCNRSLALEIGKLQGFQRQQLLKYLQVIQTCGGNIGDEVDLLHIDDVNEDD